jgi:hypothetical protein
VNIGFDTEFTKVGYETNKIVSSQLAVSTKTYIFLPRCEGYKLSRVDEESNKLIFLTTTSSSFNYKKIELSVQSCVNRIRELKYGKYDLSLMILSECLKVIKGVNYFEQDDFTVFSLPRSRIQPYIKLSDCFSYSELIKVAYTISNPVLKQTTSLIKSLISDVIQKSFSLEEGKDKMLESIYSVYHTYPFFLKQIEESDTVLPYLTHETLVESVVKQNLSNEKSLSRSYLYLPEKVSVTTKRSYTIIAHLTPADFSLLSDFDDIKEELSIVNGSFVTLGKPIKMGECCVHVRDTMLLAPGLNKSLDSIGKLYKTGYEKLKINQDDLENMHLFLARSKDEFIAYAVRDAVISLTHASWMEDFSFGIGGVIGVPISLSSIGRKYVKSVWKEMKYTGYQLSSKYLLGDVAKTMTPKGLHAVKEIGFVLPYYIANYKGGRNECFMYGVDKTTNWCDYDLTSAYTTVMAMAGHPDYNLCRRLTVDELNKLSKEEILYSYLIIQCSFEFPPTTKYPSIPCYVDETCTVYPLSGECVVTGSEYLLAKHQGCVFRYENIYLTPFFKSEYKDVKPFSTVINLIQEKRREYPKGSISNMMYKEIGNSVYGSVVRGIGDKRKFDIKSKGSIRMVGDDLTNPLIASWTTAFVRSVIGECLHSIHSLGGKVVSVTTDGFITDVVDLELKMAGSYLLSNYKVIRNDLSGNDQGLELKSEGIGVMAWSTRGQIGFNSKILATTGFQHKKYWDKRELFDVLEEVFKTDSRTIEYIMNSLRSASEVYKKGGHVTMKYRDQLFRMHFDNRRILSWETSIPNSIECLVDSIPVSDVKTGVCLRFVGSVVKKKLYGKYTNAGVRKKYLSVEETAVRNFVKGVVSSPPLFNLPTGCFSKSRDVLEFVHGYNPELKISEQSLSMYKTRLVKLGKVKRSKETDGFVQYVKKAFPTFDLDSFYLTEWKKL